MINTLPAVRAAALLLPLYLLSGAGRDPNAFRLAGPADQLLIEGSGSATISNSLIEGGLPAGSVDGGSNLHLDPLFADRDGADNIPGSIDDALGLADGSPATDAGSVSHLPADRFDLDGDGDTTEPVPTDLAGAPRSRGGAVDMGALERAGGAVGRERPEVASGLELDVPYPNPLGGDGEARFRVPRTERVEIAVYDVLGRRRLVAYDGVATAGQTHRVTVPAAGLTGGVYFLRLESASYRKSAEFVVAR